ncbi:hypothetical protein [Paludisphaera soli]|uniref:hypothetical protein n=1 Tax=Paludisphaera soli TaxID=2712865 RepID=UPI0019820C8E|nr:hypothetical protein [Paludisphaera soli]
MIRSFVAKSMPVIFVLVAMLPVLRRLRHPTLLGDDITRVVDLINFPFLTHLLRPYGDHSAPLFQLVSSLTWEISGHDIRLAPLAFCVASVTPWLLVLFLLGLWLKRETGSSTAALTAVAIVAQSPLVLEAVWWYSASSFLWAIAGILAAVLGAGALTRRPRGSLALIGIGCALAPAGTTLGVLALPLAILRAGIESGASRRMKGLAVLAAAAGLTSHTLISKMGDSDVAYVSVSGRYRLDPVGGLEHALTVPGRILWPSALGVPASWTAAPMSTWLRVGAGALALAGVAALAAWPRARWDRRLVLVGAAMIYSCYFLTFTSRMHMYKLGYWTEADLIYRFAARYHVLPLIGLAAIVAALTSTWPMIRRCDARRGLPTLVGAAVGLVMFAVQAREATQWHWMLHLPDQRATLEALHRVGVIARDEGIPREQLLRIFDPAYRPWNASVATNRPYAFHLMNLAIQAPEKVVRPISDAEARSLVTTRLTTPERFWLGAGSCPSAEPPHPLPDPQALAVARRTEVFNASEDKPGRFRLKQAPSYLEYEFDPTAGASFLSLPGLKADHDVVVAWQVASGGWRQCQSLRLLRSHLGDGDAVVDLSRLIHQPVKPISKIRIYFTNSGEVALDGPPRLLR